MVIVSACLVGVKCRYNGKCSNETYLTELVEHGQALPLCPEIFGGLPTPRSCCEIIEDKSKKRRVINTKGEDITEQFIKGAKKTLQIAKIVGAKYAVLQSRSPSCGHGKIYDGTFSGKLIKGNGFTADLLSKNDIKVFTEDQVKEFKNVISGRVVKKLDKVKCEKV